MPTVNLHRVFAALLAVMSIATAPPHYGQTIRGAAGDDRPIGAIDWVIQEVATNKVLAEGRSTVHLKDVSLQEVPPPSQMPPQTAKFFGPPRRYVPKSIRLNDQFALEMAEYPVASKFEKRGFGLISKRTDVSTFSWEWFVIKTNVRAEKLQEIGELGIDLTQVGTDFEVTRTEFLTDVVFRIARMGVDTPGTSSWRVTILKGSTINWPSLVDGHVVPN